MSVFDFFKHWRGSARSAARPAPAGSDAAALQGLNTPDFEGLLGEAFRAQGYQVTATGGSTVDGGASLVLRRERQTHLVHCKQWRAARIGVDIAQALHAAMKARDASGGFIVCAGRFSRDASAYAAGANIRLIEGPALAAMIRRVRSATAGPTSAPAPSVR